MPIRVKSAAALPFGLPVPPPGWVQKRSGISLCMIVKNEERFLERCLASARDAVDEIVIVDTGSTDGTIEIARAFGARVEQREWRNDFGWARNQAIELATKRWILQLDADEELSDDSKAALRSLKNAPAYLTGLWVRCINRADQYLGDDGALSHVVVRLFPNHERIRYYGLIHEFPSVDGSHLTLEAQPSPIKIVHHGYLRDVMTDRSKYERNMAIIEEATRRYPDDAYNWYNLGITTHLCGDHARAVESLERMWQVASEHGLRLFLPNGLSLLADILTDYCGRADEALAHAHKALELAPKYSNAHFSAGRALAALGRFDEAREMLQAAIDDEAHTERQYVVDEEVARWKAHNVIGGTFLMQGECDKALHWFDAGLENKPKAQPLRINRAKALERLGRLDEAEKALRALCDDFSDEQSVLALVNFLIACGKTDDAIATIDRYHDSCSSQAAGALLLAAAAMVQRSGSGTGEEHLVRAAHFQPGCADILNPLEAIYRERGDEDAIGRLRAAEALTEPQAAGDFARRAQIALSEGDSARALSIAERGLAAAPGDAALRYNAAVACINLGKGERSLEHLAAIGEVNAELHARVEFLRAVLLRNLGRPAEALSAVNRVLEVSGPQLDALLLRASLCEQLGKSEEAESVLRSALPLAKMRVAAELGGFYMRAGRFADAQRVAEEALA